MLPSFKFISWLVLVDSVSWKDWDMWGALGQWAGAIGTVWAVLVALRQAKEARKQAEEAKREAEEAKRPKGKISYGILRESQKLLLILTNIKPIPIYILHTEVYEVNDASGEKLGSIKEFKWDGNKSIPMGDTCIIEVPFSTIRQAIGNRSDVLFHFHFRSSLGDLYGGTIYVRKNEKNDTDFYFHIVNDLKCSRFEAKQRARGKPITLPPLSNNS